MTYDVGIFEGLVTIGISSYFLYKIKKDNFEFKEKIKFSINMYNLEKELSFQNRKIFLKRMSNQITEPALRTINYLPLMFINSVGILSFVSTQENLVSKAYLSFGSLYLINKLKNKYKTYKISENIPNGFFEVHKSKIPGKFEIKKIEKPFLDLEKILKENHI